MLATPAVLAWCAWAGFEQSALLGLLVVLASLAIAGRILFAAVPSFKPVSAIAIIAGIVLGRHSGFMVGSLAALGSNFVLGQGAWTPWQMYAWGLVGYLAGVLFPALDDERPRRLAVLAYGFASGLLYGVILNAWSIIGFYRPTSLAGMAAIFGSALPFDVVHGLATVAFLAVLYVPWARRLRRVRERWGLGEGPGPR